MKYGILEEKIFEFPTYKIHLLHTHYKNDCYRVKEIKYVNDNKVSSNEWLSGEPAYSVYKRWYETLDEQTKTKTSNM